MRWLLLAILLVGCPASPAPTPPVLAPQPPPAPAHKRGRLGWVDANDKTMPVEGVFLLYRPKAKELVFELFPLEPTEAMIPQLLKGNALGAVSAMDKGPDPELWPTWCPYVVYKAADPADKTAFGLPSLDVWAVDDRIHQISTSSLEETEHKLAGKLEDGALVTLTCKGTAKLETPVRTDRLAWELDVKTKVHVAGD